MINPYIFPGLPMSSTLHHKMVTSVITASQIISTVCEVLGVTRDELVSPVKVRALTDARYIAMSLILQALPDIKVKQVGLLLNRDHSTVVHARKTFNILNGKDKHFTKKVNLVLNHR